MNLELSNSLWFVPLSMVFAPAYAVDYLTIAEAQQQLFGKNASFIESPFILGDDEREIIKKESGVRQRQSKQPVWRVEKNGELAGWFMMDDVIGKHEYITYAIGIDLSGNMSGLEILSYRETHGGQVTDTAWRKQFKGKSLADPFKLDRDVVNISGATLSCRNLLDGSKRLLVIFKLMRQRGFVF